MDESSVVIRSRTRLMAQSYNQEKGIDFDFFVPVARLESIIMLLAFACHKILFYIKWILKVHF